MATIELIRKRVGNDIKMAVRLVDSEVAVDWTTVSKVKAVMVSDQQRIMMGECRIVGPDTQDATKLLMVYPAVQPQYLGVARLVLTVTYFGNVSTLDIPVLIFVASTAEEGTDTVEVEAPADLDPEDNNLELELEDIDTSVIQAAIDAANEAATAANEAAESANEAVAHFKGGATGQVLSKKSNADYDFEWQDAGGVGAPVWGNITGTLSAQTDLQDALDAKQGTISDLSDIRSGAEAGASAVQPGDLATVATSGDYDDLLNKPSIPSAPGTLNTDNSSAQSVNSSEALSGTVKLHKVSKTGSYNDLNNKPTIPAAQVNSDWNANSGIAEILNKPSLAAVATSGSYNDLSNKPTIPAAPGTLDTTATTAQATSSSEALSGNVTLHKISKTGKYSDLSGKPTVPVITLNGSTAGNPSFYAPTSAGTAGQVLVSTGGAPTWQAAPSGGGDVTDVTLGGTSVVDGSGVAVLPAYPVLESLTNAEIDTIWAAA